MRITFCLLVAYLFIAASAHAQAITVIPPLPKTECKKLWEEKTLLATHQHQYQAGESYEEFLKRTDRKNCYKEWNVLIYMEAQNDLTPYALWDMYELERSYPELETSGSSIHTDVLVHLDTLKKPGATWYHMFQSKRDLEATINLGMVKGWNESEIESPVASPVIANLGDTAATRFQRFLEWGLRTYPSKHTVVVLWSHGQGWTSARYRAKMPAKPAAETQSTTEPEKPNPFLERNWGGIAFDDKTGSFMDIPALRRTLQGVAMQLGRPIDLFIADACLMQMNEVAFEIGNSVRAFRDPETLPPRILGKARDPEEVLIGAPYPAVRFISGSSQIQNLFGLPYQALTSELNQKGTHLPALRASLESEAKAFQDEGKSEEAAAVRAQLNDPAYLVARAIPQVMEASMNPESGSQGKRDPDGAKFLLMNSIDSEKLTHSLSPTLHILGSKLRAYLEEPGFAARQVQVQVLIDKMPFFPGNAEDLGLFLGGLKKTLKIEALRAGQESPAAKDLNTQILATEHALKETVVSFVYGSDYKITNNPSLKGAVARSLSVWIPLTPEELATREEDFKRSKFYKLNLEDGWSSWFPALVGRKSQ